MWYAISFYGIIGPYFCFLEDDSGRATNVTPGRCANVIATFSTDELAARFPQISEASWFQQDDATSRTHQGYAVRLFFHNRIVFRNDDVLWFPGSRDLSAYDFLSWGI
jgi:hypothetical protein